MRIKELNIIEFGGLIGRRYELSEGLNVFEGNNETGKSTLWLFIKFMLYGMQKKGHPERDKAINRATHRASGTMTVCFGGEDYRIERSFSEGSRGKVATYRVSDGERVFEGEEPGEAMLGVPRDIFENSASIGQSACAGLGGEKGAAAIRNLLSSADESVDVEKIQKKLNAIRVAYRHINGKGGKLYDASGRISSLEQRLTQATDNRAKIAEYEERLARNDENIRQTETDLEAARGLTEVLGRREILGRFDRLAENRQREAELLALRDALCEREARGGHVPTAAEGASLFAAVESCDAAEAALAKAEERLAGLSSQSPTAEDEELSAVGEQIERQGGVNSVLASAVKAETKRTAGVFALGTGAVLFIACAACSFAIHALFWVGAALSLILCAVGAFLCVRGASERKGGLLGQIPKGAAAEEYAGGCVTAYRRVQVYRSTLADAESALSGARTHLDFARAELKRALGRVRLEAAFDVESARAEAERIRGFIDEYTALCGRLDAIGGMIKGDAEVLAVYDESELRASVGDVRVPSTSLSEAQKQRKFHEERLRTLKARDNDLRTELINLKATGEDPTALCDALSELKEKYAAAEHYYEAVVLAMDGIDRAAAAMQGSIAPAIGARAAELISRVTDGRYGAINLGRALDVTLVDGDGLTTTGDMMSGGMKDAAYLSLRIALMQRIFGAEQPPLMMDEALCQLDGERVERVLGQLGALAAEGLQILLFTCHTREGELCERLNIDSKRFVMDGLCGEKQ